MTLKYPITMETPVQYAPQVGEARAAELATLGIKLCGDLLFHYPRDYLKYAEEGRIEDMKVGEMATAKGQILQTRMIPRKPRRFEVLIEDLVEGGGSKAKTPKRCVLTWFNPYGLDQKLQPGMVVRVTGKVTSFADRMQMVQPKWEEVAESEDGEKKAARVDAVYPATMDLQTGMISKIVGGVLEALIPAQAEWFDETFLRERGLMTRREALWAIHRPINLDAAKQARRTLAYHEFFLHQAAMAIKRYHARNNSPATPLRVDDAVDGRIRALLPFKMTGAQDRVIASIRKDLNSAKPMNRLLQGDVGSGKTVVALYAMLCAAATVAETQNSKHKTSLAGEPALEGRGFSGHQAALMAPTEILAEQHFLTLTRLLEGKKVKIVLLTGSVQGKERVAILKQVEDGSVGLVVGTHALLGESVRFRNLAVVVVDEQHKFGVEQRSQIRTKPSAGGERGTTTGVPHMLVMTATPIPRTLAMTTFGDLDVSVIDELPPGRQTIFTRMTPASNRRDVYAWLGEHLRKQESAAGKRGQAYVVVPAIDEGELELRTVSGVQEELQKDVLKDFRIGLLHGRMTQEMRQHVMERFRQGLLDVLVATTVIEVGVDVPNATVMVIEHADRFGLSQLHQLRGRVGRGSEQSYCVLLGDQTTDDGISRLQAMVQYSSGFKIAEEDLKLRGMGQLIGTAQSGRTDLHFADLLFDPQLLPLSRRDAFNMIASDPRLLDPSHTVLRNQVLGTYADSITLADVG